jgi:hypothetical protein
MTTDQKTLPSLAIGQAITESLVCDPRSGEVAAYCGTPAFGSHNRLVTHHAVHTREEGGSLTRTVTPQ